MTGIEFETPEGKKIVPLSEIVMYLFRKLPKKQRDKFVKEASNIPSW